MNAHAQPEPVDVCLVVEGCYPFVAGGVSTWIDWLIRTQPDLSFGVVALTADETPREAKYQMPPNLRFLEVLPLSRRVRKPAGDDLRFDHARMTDRMCRLLKDGDATAFAELVEFTSSPARRRGLAWPPIGSAPRRPAPGYSDLIGSRAMWDVMVACYQRLTPHASFPDFFWAWRTLVGGLFSVLTAPIPRAHSYHTISTGYAGLFAARASVATGRPAAITEHGIYTNERRIDLIMAEWLEDSIATGLGGGETRRDVRGFWIDCFEGYARIAYQVASRITTLYGANQSFQRALGASDDKLSVIPNGIELEKFANLVPETPRPRPTVGLLGRVVPIKDIKGFIAAAGVMKREVPDVRVLVMGPTDEDPAYFTECKRMVDDLDLGRTIEFTGKVNILDYLPKVDVLVLTSISEAQPLVLLEAGAARIPCVATDVGSCREIIEGAPDEEPNLGPGGRVVPPMASAEVGLAVAELLKDDALRTRCGEALRRRVEHHFTSRASAERYGALYRELIAG